jgi:cation transport ATPase
VDYRYPVDGHGGDYVSPPAQRHESFLSGPSAYSSFDHARRFTSRQAFVLITLAAALLALVGVAAEYTRIVPEWVMLILFLVAFFLYGYCIKRAWKVARLVKRIRRRIRRHSGNNPKLTK